MLEFARKKIETDEDGCLVRFDDWDEDVARALAAQEGIGELTSDRLSMLKFIRDYYKKYDFFPIVRSICKNVSDIIWLGRQFGSLLPERF